ncbi:hypothetical protein [Paraclostridium sp.]|uniref:hypothetical protein n=1 Tax=Paraclostridium sp. TaxID=2023273 RepID=UPI003F6803EB
MGREVGDYELIKKLFNENKECIEDDFIIIDNYLVDALSKFFIEKIQYINAEKEIFIYTININNNDSKKVETDYKTRKYIIKQLAINNNNNKEYMKYGQNKVRCSIPVIEGYEKLALDRNFYKTYY